MIRTGVYSVQRVLELVPYGIKSKGQISPVPRADFGGDMIRMDSLRYQLFANSVKCVCCGIEGVFFAKELSSPKSKQKTCHLNLYAIDSEGKEVLMTKDHIVPKSKGGIKNYINNLQVMCKHCNELKGNSL
ncbi:MAG: HNH endonuclease [Candidatus Peribacteraceae bacterium]|nr:HNH endonuclease [Candidatus Peribacteraceae bacterium]